MSGFFEIESMSRAATPDIAIITNIGSSHLEMLGTRENIRKAKLEITSGLKKDGVLIINGDDPMLASYDCGVKTLKVGIFGEDCDFRAVDIEESAAGAAFTVIYPDKTSERYSIALRGHHNVYAALFGCATAELLGIERERVKRGLPAFGGVKMRQNIYELGGITVIEDCYNASPESMRAAISVASSMAKEGSKRFVALLGDMKELGEDSPELHREIGSFAAQNGLKLLVSYGELAKNTADEAQMCGVEVKRCDSADAESAAEMLISSLEENDLLLVKASRSMKAENVIKIIKARMEINDNV
jgi:UDP-N-acetylmuramoyl-tripeptide--D-alanyl-D-alanine ligase